MRILSHGKPPSSELFRGTCSRCGCVIEISGEEGHPSTLSNMRLFPCPEKDCRHPNVVCKAVEDVPA